MAFESFGPNLITHSDKNANLGAAASKVGNLAHVEHTVQYGTHALRK